jgi:hypothetical protein
MSSQTRQVMRARALAYVLTWQALMNALAPSRSNSSSSKRPPFSHFSRYVSNGWTRNEKSGSALGFFCYSANAIFLTLVII